jgi:endoglucanase
MFSDMRMNRRQFLKTTASIAALSATGVRAAERGETVMKASSEQVPSASHLPRWRGFNLLEKFTNHRNAPFRESDFEWIAELGFDFVRLPLSYQCWADTSDWLNLK